MCGRFALFHGQEKLRQALKDCGLAESVALPDLAPRAHITPGQDILAIARTRTGATKAGAMLWGFVAPGSGRRQETPRAAIINARAETVHEKPLFRDHLWHRRCLIPASGYFEWATIEGDRKRPFFITAAESPEKQAPKTLALESIPAEPRFPPLFFCALWVRTAGFSKARCVILTTTAAPGLAAIHPRMPLHLAQNSAEHWLNPATEKEAVLEILKKAQDDCAGFSYVSGAAEPPAQSSRHGRLDHHGDLFGAPPAAEPQNAPPHL